MRQALELALEALKENVHELIAENKALKEALAQPEQKPVKMVAYNCTCGRTMKFESVHGVVAPQRTWVGLTDEELREFDVDPIEAKLMIAKLKGKNT